MIEKFYEKLVNEFNDYHESLYNLPVNQIINKSYETAIKAEIVVMFDIDEYPEGKFRFKESDIELLYKLNRPLFTMYEYFKKSNSNIIRPIENAIDDLIKKCRILKQEEELKREL